VKHRWTAGLFLVLLVGGVAFHGCGDDDPTQPPSQLLFPASWAGIWRLTLNERDCATDSFVGVDVSVDTICAGMSLVEFFDLTDGQVALSCSGSMTDSHIDATCTGHESFFDCDVTLRLSANRADSTLSGTGSIRTSGCPVASCLEFDILGRRLAPAPTGCPAAANGLARRLLGRNAGASLPRDRELHAPRRGEDPPARPEPPAPHERE
jgi:hypothetical protein